MEWRWVMYSGVFTMEKDGNVFSVEDFIPAGATGKIYANSNKTGMSWGMVRKRK